MSTAAFLRWDSARFGTAPRIWIRSSPSAPPASLVYGVFAIYRMGYGLGVGNAELVHRYHMDLYFESAAMILALITVGKFLETRSKGRTGEALAV